MVNIQYEDFVSDDYRSGGYISDERMATYHQVIPGVYQVTLTDENGEYVGHTNQLEKAPDQCLYWIETGEWPGSLLSVGVCQCRVCRERRAKELNL